MRKMSYEERLREYEKEKAMLRFKNLSYEEYEREIRRIADKWRV